VTARINQEAEAALQEREKANILVVDDLQEKHVVFRTILDELGENIVSARSGKEALRFILEKEFAVILLDVNMPDIDGLETASLIRHYKKSAQTPIVFITAYVDELQAKRGYALGAVDYIPSPVVPEVLRSKVRVFVELYRMNRQLQLRAAEREALARSEAARAAAEEAIHRADLPVGGQPAVVALAGHRAHQPGAARPVGPDARRAGRPGDHRQGRRRPAVASQQRGGPGKPARGTARSGRRGAAGQAVHPVAGRRHGRGHLPHCHGRRVRGALVLLGRRSSSTARGWRWPRKWPAGRRSRWRTRGSTVPCRRRTGARTSSWPCWRTSCAIRWHPSATRCTSCKAPMSPPTMHWARDVISRQADHMARLIDDLLDVSRIVQGKVVVKPESLGLASLVERSAEATMPKIEARSQQVLELPDEPIVVDGDRCAWRRCCPT
jgi:CheY-like chemotaxis protein